MLLRLLIYSPKAPFLIKPQQQNLELLIIYNAAMSFLGIVRLLGAAISMRMVLAQSSQFNGTIAVDSDTTNIINITVTNEGVHNYSILANNNMFDDSHPFAPFTVQTTAGTPVPLAGSRFEYTTLTDSQFLTFPPGTTWTRLFNVSEFLLPDSKLTVATSECFIITLPPSVPAILLDNMTPSQHLADIFFSVGVKDVPLESIPLHHNVSDPAGASVIPGHNIGGTQGGGGQDGSDLSGTSTSTAAAFGLTVAAQPAGITTTKNKAASSN